MAEIKEKQIQQPEDIDWIVPPGIRLSVLQFLDLCSIVAAKPDRPIKDKKPVIIFGDTGVGKSLFLHLFIKYCETTHNIPAAKIHIVNIASLNTSLIESELFGHTRGAFSGAVHTRIGHIKQADRGVLVIEEIGDIPKPIQAKLLTFIEDGYFYPVGLDKRECASVQIIAATNKEREKDAFREDFINRFFPFYIPSIYERRGDVLYYFYNMFPDVLSKLTQSEVFSLMAYHWPGNVREIEKIGLLLKWRDGLKLKFRTQNTLKNVMPILLKTKYTALNLNLQSRPIIKHLQDVRGKVKLISFFKKMGIDLTMERLAFRENIKKEYTYKDLEDKYMDYKIKFLEYLEFTPWVLALDNFIAMFWDSYSLDKIENDLLDIKPGDGKDKVSLDISITPNNWDENDRKLREMILEYRLNLNSRYEGNVVEVNLDECRQEDIDKLQWEIYHRRIKKFDGKIAPAARNLGIDPNTLRRKYEKKPNTIKPSK